MSKAVIYSRVSTEEQADKGFSLIAQKNECIEKAKELNCDEIYEYCDEGISGSILERPSLISALELIKKIHVDYFICYEPSRMSRNVSHQLILIDTIKKYDTKLIFVRSNFEDTAEGRFQITIMAAVDEYERARLKIRTELGKRVKANQKLLTHNPNIFGYIFDKETDTLKVNESQAKIVNKIFDWVVDLGLGPPQIADELNRQRIPTMRQKSWSRVSVNRILKNFSYTGTLYIRRFDTREYKFNKFKAKEDKIKIKQRPKDQWIQIEIPQIINLDKWHKVNSILKRIQKTNKTSKNKNKTFNILVKCGKCGSVMYSKKSGENIYYCCSKKYLYNNDKVKKCLNKLYKASDIEMIVWQKTSEIIINKIINDIDFTKKVCYQEVIGRNVDSYKNILKAKLDKMKQEVRNILMKLIIEEIDIKENIILMKVLLKN